LLALGSGSFKVMQAEATLPLHVASYRYVDEQVTP
jgi:hypothetical protein